MAGQIVLPQGYVLDTPTLSQGYVLDAAPQEVPQDFSARMQADFAKRQQQATELTNRAENGQGNFSNTLQMTGIGTGLIGDTAANAVGSAARYAKDLMPQYMQDFYSGIGNQAKEQIAGSDFAKGAEYLLGQGANKAQQLEKQYPTTMNNLGAVANIAGVVPAGFGVKKAVELAAETPKVAGNVINSVGSYPINKLADYLIKKEAIKSGEIVAQDLPKPLQMVYNRLRADYPDYAEFKKVLNSYASKPDQALIQAGGERTTRLGEGAAQYTSGGARATEFFDEAIGKAPEKLKTAIGKTVSPSTKYYDDLDTMVEAGQAKAAPLYKAAFKNNQVVESTVINNILNTPSGKRALAKAAESAANKMSRVAKPDPELTALARELGVASEGGVSRGLKLSSLDQVKKSMDKQIGDALRGPTPSDANEIIALKNALVDELDAADKSGLYAKARKASGDYLSNKSAMDSGLNFLKEDKEIITRNFNDMGAAEKQAYKTGVVKTLRNKIETTQDGANVARLFKTPATRDKLKAILPERDYNRLLSEAMTQDGLFKLRNQLTGNSRTALRQIEAQDFEGQGAQLVQDLASKGATRTGIDNSIRWIAKRFDGLSDKTAKEVADILYEQDPKKKYEIVKFLTNQANSEGQGLRKTEAAKKLQAFYTISDKVAKEKNLELSPQAQEAVKQAQQSLKKSTLQESFQAKKDAALNKTKK